MMDNKFKFYPLPAEGIDLMRQYTAIGDKLDADIERLQLEYRERANSLYAAGRSQLHDLWVKMSNMAGVDADTSWDSPDWHIEGRYVDSGFAALTFAPQPKNSLAAMLGVPQEEDETETKGAPKGATLN